MEYEVDNWLPKKKITDNAAFNLGTVFLGIHASSAGRTS